MVLVDTSAWIRALSNRAPFAEELARLLDRDEVAGHDLVFGELLIGDRGGRGKALADYDLLRRAPNVPHADVVQLVNTRRLHGRGIGWIDAHLLASALVSGARLWTADVRLAEI